MATLVSGLVIGVIRISLELSKNHFEPGSILHTLGNMNFLTFAAWFFLVSILITIVVSLLSEVPSYEKLRGLTFGTLTKEQREENRNSYHLGDVVASVLVVGIVVFVMSSFNG